MKSCINKRNSLYKKWKKKPSPEIHQQYKDCRSRCQRLLRKSHVNYTESIFSSKDCTNSKFWSYIKHKRKESCNVAPLRENGVLISDAIGKANILNRQYCSVFNKDNRGCEPSKGESDIPDMPPIKVTESGVLKLLQSLNPNKAAGPDKISPMVLKKLSNVLSRPLAVLFQKSIDSGEVPRQWKNANVTPLFKKGDKNKPANYRPVSLTAVCCKLCEHLIAKAIMNHLDQNNILSDLQHGFRSKRSCETQLLMFIDELLCEMSEGRQVDAVVMDFSKAFDVVPHGSLLVKMAFYGIRGSTLSWVDSFLSGRTQRVFVDGEPSNSAAVTSGVPQGSVLGPFLFLMYINDMPETISSQSRLFADDTIVYRSIKSQDDCIQLQKDLESLEKWESKWGMSFNPSKCETIHISRKKTPVITPYMLKQEPLARTKTANYLGITIAEDLSWNQHVAKTAAKGNKMLGFVKRNVKTAVQTTKEYAYKSLVRPTLEYASTVWSPGKKLLSSAIEKVQRRAARYVTNRYQRTDSVSSIVDDLKWDLLEERRKKSRVIMLQKIRTGLVAIPPTKLTPATRQTRGHNLKFLQIPTRTNYHKCSFYPNAIKLWNSLPSKLVQMDNIDEFKDAIGSVHLTALELRYD